MFIDQSRFKFTDIVLEYESILKTEWFADGDWTTIPSFNEVAKELGCVNEVDQGPTWRIAPNKNLGFKNYPHHQKRFPKSWELMTTWGDVCPGGGYSILLPNSQIKPHRDGDNDGTIARIHIPIYLPEGDIGICVDNINSKWQYGELLIFDNSLEHSVWNNTNEARIIFLFDLPKEFCLK